MRNKSITIIPKQLMKKVLWTILLLFSALTSAVAQTNAITSDEDSTIAVIAFFNKNDSIEYSYSKTETKISDSDTTRTSGVEAQFRIVVLDSTSKGYRLEYTPLSWKADNETDSVKSGIKLEAKSQTPAIFTTDEFGEIQHLENWRTIRDKALPVITKFFDDQYEKNPGIDSIMPKKNLTSLLKLGFITEDAAKGLYGDFTTMFTLNGSAYNIGITNTTDSSAGYPVNISLLATYEEPDTADENSYPGDYNIRYNALVTIPASEVQELTSSLLGALLSKELSDKTDEAIDDSLNVPMEVRELTDYHFFLNGWPKLVRKQTIISLGKETEKVTTETIEWNRYRWNEPQDDIDDTNNSAVSL